MRKTIERTDVLKRMISSKITTTNVGPVTREIANVVIENTSVLKDLEGQVYGNGKKGLLFLYAQLDIRLDGLSKDLTEFITESRDERKARKRKEDSHQDWFHVLVDWFVKQCLPLIIAALVLGAIGFTFAVAYHLRVSGDWIPSTTP